jgi:type IV fimbrial biogenesis protein FimT
VVLTGSTVISSQAALPNGFLLSESGGGVALVFWPTGIGATISTLTLCRATPTVGDQQRTIKVSATGRPEITKVKGASSCP